MGRATGAELNAEDGWAVMSNRFLRWVDTWIEENIPPGANFDIESHEAKAKRLSEKLFAEAAAAGFTNFETEEERKCVPPLVLAAVSNVDFTGSPKVSPVQGRVRHRCVSARDLSASI